MNEEQAIAFLQEHGTLSEHASEALIAAWVGVIDFLMRNPSKRCIPLLISAFGEGAHMEVDTSIQTLLRKFPLEDMYPHLKAGLNDERSAVRQWCADTVQYFPHPDFVPDLQRMLQEEDVLSRHESVVALAKIKGEKVKHIAALALPGEVDEEVRSLLLELVDD